MKQCIVLKLTLVYPRAGILICSCISKIHTRPVFQSSGGFHITMKKTKSVNSPGLDGG